MRDHIRGASGLLFLYANPALLKRTDTAAAEASAATAAPRVTYEITGYLRFGCGLAFAACAPAVYSGSGREEASFKFARYTRLRLGG